MVAMATVLAMTPDILVLDEPTSNLDMKARRELIEILKKFRHTILLATHDLALVEELCPRSIVIEEGRVTADTLTERIFADSALCLRLGISPN